MKFSYKKIFGNPATIVPPISCPVCCYPCTPLCTDWPNCNFAANCTCSQGIPNQGVQNCACCAEKSVIVCTDLCAYNCNGNYTSSCIDCFDYSCTGYSAGYICSSCEFSPRPSFPIGGSIGTCNTIGGNGGPYTSRIDIRGQYGGFTGFSSRMYNFSTYGCGAANGNCGQFLGNCDPDYARPYVRRYFKSPEQSGVLGITGFGVDYACLSWKSDKPTRVMVLSGRNVYRYSGYLAGDTGSNFNASTQVPYGCTSGNYVQRYYPWISTGGITAFCSDTSLKPLGVSGISEMEGCLGRTFPLPDRISGLPLWGQSLSTSVGITNNHGETCGSTAACIGCGCLTGSTNPTSYGHYGVGLTSQRPYNPQGYILESGTDFLDNINSSQWKGIPSCSIWGFANAVYDRIGYLAVRKGLISDPPPTSGRWRDVLVKDSGLSSSYFEIKNFIDLHHAMFNASPSTVYNDGGKDPYHRLKNYASYFSRDWTNAVNAITDNMGFWTFKILSPNIFLFDQTPYDAASTAEDAWKHIYIIGNANILFDSGCTYPDGLTNNALDETTEPYLSPDGFDANTDIFSRDDARHHILRLDEVNHALNNGRPGLTANSARLVVFPSCKAELTPSATASFEAVVNPLSPVVIHGDCTQSSCGVYQIESNTVDSDFLNTFACACSVCARIGDGTTRYPAYTDQRLYTSLGGSIPSCYNGPQDWRRDSSSNRYFPHPRLMRGTDTNGADCRYYGPRRLNWYML